MGTVSAYETSAGRRYRVRYRKPDSSQTDKRGFRTKREAELFLASVEISVARGDFVDASAARVTIAELGTVWVKQLTHLKPSTQRPLEIAWRLHVEPRWGRIAVSAVGHSGVQAWVTEMQKSRGATSVLRAYGVLASILDVAVADRRIHANPARGVKLPRRVRREHRYLTHGHVSALALAAGDKGALVLLLAYCGLRWGEAAGLRVKDIDATRRRVFVSQNAVEVGGEIHVGTPKTHKRRSVPFPATLVPMFADACDPKGTYRPLVRRSTRLIYPPLQDGQGLVLARSDVGRTGGPHPARPAAHGRKSRRAVRCEREGCATDARPLVGGDDARCLCGPLRRRPRPRRRAARRGFS